MNHSGGEIEKALATTKYTNGYPSLAAFIASDHDKSTEIYRRFGKLSARNLLYLQSELVELEAKQNAFDEEDVRGPMDTKACARDWAVFAERAKNPANEREKKRMELAMEIRAKIKEYREAIILERELIRLNKPSSRTLEAFRNVFNNVGKTGVPILDGRSQAIFHDENDLMSLSVNEDADRLTRFLQNYCPVFFIKERPDRSSPLAYVSEHRIQLFVIVVNVLLAAVLLFGAIFNLYFVTEDQKRLGLVAGYTVAFAVCVGLLTNARRSEIFGACAAYAAVLVVFVSGNIAEMRNTTKSP